MLHLDFQLFGQPILVIAALSYATCAALIFAARFWPRLAGRPADSSAIQSAHTRMTPRVGGLGVLAALILMMFLGPDSVKKAYSYLVLSSIFLVIAGLLEDLGFGVTPRIRLFAIMASSLAVVAISGLWIPQLGIAKLDHLASFWIVGIPVTLLITAGISNGFNLIDGVNGLAGFTAITAAIAMAAIARAAGVEDLAYLSTMLAAGIFGFWILNYPFGVIFLGDAGAYTLGFVLSWFGIAIMINAPSVTPWAILLTVFWPVSDMLLAIFRRKSNKRPNMQPDRLHYHQMIMRSTELIWLGRNRRNISNPLTTLFLAPFIIAPAIAGVMLWDQPLYAFLAVILFSALFTLKYFIAFPVVKKLLPDLNARIKNRSLGEV